MVKNTVICQYAPLENHSQEDQSHVREYVRFPPKKLWASRILSEPGTGNSTKSLEFISLSQTPSTHSAHFVALATPGKYQLSKGHWHAVKIALSTKWYIRCFHAVNGYKSNYMATGWPKSTFLTHQRHKGDFQPIGFKLNFITQLVQKWFYTLYVASSGLLAASGKVWFS